MGGPRTVIVGGGLAGMAAAVAMHSAGAAVTLLESRQNLGGRAGSFADPKTGEILDNCQHVVLGCCTNLLDLYKRLGVADRIRWQEVIRFVDPAGRSHEIWGMPGWPAPLHLGLAGATFSALSLRERLALARGMLVMQRLGKSGRLRLANVPFGQWLAEHHQPASLIDKFYEIVLVSALNENCRQASAECAIQVFQEGMLAHSDAYRMGTPACPLGTLYEKFPCPDVRMGARMTGLRFDGDRVLGVETAEGFLEADAVVLAVNYHALEKFIPAALYAKDSRFGGLAELESVPILGAHLWFDRPILHHPHAALMSGPLQWLFRKEGSDGSAVHGVISAAREWAAVPREEALRQFTAQIRGTFPHARGAGLKRGVIVVEKRATFSPKPGVERLRPGQSPPAGGISKLYLAGDYTRTGWPATMEGAVRSGYLAAEAVLGAPGGFLVRDLAAQWPARWLETAFL